MSLDFAKVDTLSAINPVGYITCADELSAKQYVPGKISRTCSAYLGAAIGPLAQSPSPTRNLAVAVACAVSVTWASFDPDLTPPPCPPCPPFPPFSTLSTLSTLTPPPRSPPLSSNRYICFMFEVVSHDGARHHFSKRFSEFEAMRKQSLKYGKLPLLPPKGGLFGKVGMNQTRVHKRYVALGKWLAACLEHMQTSSDDPGGRSSELCELFFDYVSANQAPTPSVRARQIFYHEENVPPENGSAAAKRVVSVAEESKRRGPVRGHGLSDAERRLQNRARGNSKGGGGGGGKRGGKRGRGGSSGDGDGDGEYDEEYDEEVEGEDEDDDSGFERA